MLTQAVRGVLNVTFVQQTQRASYPFKSRAYVIHIHVRPAGFSPGGRRALLCSETLSSTRAKMLRVKSSLYICTLGMPCVL